MPIINDIPQGNVTSPLGAHLVYATKMDSSNNEITEILQQDYDIVFTEEEDILYAKSIKYEPETASKEPLVSTNAQGAISELNEKILNKEIVMDDTLSAISTNGVQNKIITNALSTQDTNLRNYINTQDNALRSSINTDLSTQDTNLRNYINAQDDTLKTELVNQDAALKATIDADLSTQNTNLRNYINDQDNALKSAINANLATQDTNLRNYVNTSVASKAPINSPIFTGTVSQSNGSAPISSSIRYFRPILISTTEPTADMGQIGDICIVYST